MCKGSLDSHLQCDSLSNACHKLALQNTVSESGDSMKHVHARLLCRVTYKVAFAERHWRTEVLEEKVHALVRTKQISYLNDCLA